MLPRKILNLESSKIRLPAFWGSLTLFYFCFEHFYTFHQTFYLVKGRAAAPSGPLSPHLTIRQDLCYSMVDSAKPTKTRKYINLLFCPIMVSIMATGSDSWYFKILIFFSHIYSYYFNFTLTKNNTFVLLTSTVWILLKNAI